MNAVPSNIEGAATDWHNLSHHGKDPEKIAELALVVKAKLRCFNKFLNKLKSVQETSGDLLDNTAILFGSNLGDASSHN
ncbi:MAG: DUF1552 domain-containing protein [Lentisphaerales bacterium]|nr:DUF1552 domain-containing protein [Lentisphaerales bacterium]